MTTACGLWASGFNLSNVIARMNTVAPLYLEAVISRSIQTLLLFWDMMMKLGVLIGLCKCDIW
jgi:hypothetical protein